LPLERCRCLKKSFAGFVFRMDFQKVNNIVVVIFPGDTQGGGKYAANYTLDVRISTGYQ
jgi:hypothetical protein